MTENAWPCFRPSLRCQDRVAHFPLWNNIKVRAWIPYDIQHFLKLQILAGEWKGAFKQVTSSAKWNFALRQQLEFLSYCKSSGFLKVINQSWDWIGMKGFRLLWEINLWCFCRCSACLSSLKQERNRPNWAQKRVYNTLKNKPCLLEDFEWELST